jgi:hypothetical protein
METFGLSCGLWRATRPRGVGAAGNGDTDLGQPAICDHYASPGQRVAVEQRRQKFERYTAVEASP